MEEWETDDELESVADLLAELGIEECED